MSRNYNNCTSVNVLLIVIKRLNDPLIMTNKLALAPLTVTVYKEQATTHVSRSSVYCCYHSSLLRLFVLVCLSLYSALLL